MAVTPATLIPNLQSSLNASGLTGASLPQMATGFALGFIQWLATIPVVTTHAGVIGAGTGTGKITIDPASGTATCAASLGGQGFTGTMLASLCTGIVTGLSIELNSTAQVQVAIAGTSTGTGFGTLSLASGTALTPLLYQSLLGQGITGSKATNLAQGFGQGLGTWIKTGIINTVDVGTPAPPFNPSTGVGTGKIF